MARVRAARVRAWIAPLLAGMALRRGEVDDRAAALDRPGDAVGDREWRDSLAVSHESETDRMSYERRSELLRVQRVEFHAFDL
jgi:hypothetical protein